MFFLKISIVARHVAHCQCASQLVAVASAQLSPAGGRVCFVSFFLLSMVIYCAYASEFWEYQSRFDFLDARTYETRLRTRLRGRAGMDANVSQDGPAVLSGPALSPAMAGAASVFVPAAVNWPGDGPP